MSDVEPAVAAVLAQCRSRAIRISTAESCTGGMLGAWITAVAGSSDVFDRGFITYSNRAKSEMLGVSLQTLDAHGAVSEPVAREMAAGARDRADVDLAVSITGIAGPGGSEHKPEGRVCFGLATANGTKSETVEFGALGRGQVREAAARHALALLERAVS